MKKRLGLVVLLVSALFMGCSSDTDDKKEDIDEVAAVSATINGKEWKATKIKKVVLVQNIPNVGVQLLNLYFNDDSQALSLICESSLSSNDTMPLKEYFYNDTDTNAWFLNYYLIDGVGYVRHSQKYGKITITAMNPEKKTVSGTFSFRAEKENVYQTEIVAPDVFEVTNGVFTNLPYSVIKGK
ncbi:DUF6252 family protein [Flavobacterium poyangense]|uniref:DUF6252 family protein n=1 Tax=Flavobacterium poyangense TaxID=2204302 RepID=UPI00141F7BC8|nr:DUF6252 family protein [Flavobacterium sp. JXAS1]